MQTRNRPQSPDEAILQAPSCPVDYVARELIELAGHRVDIQLAARNLTEIELILFVLSRAASASRPAVHRIELPLYRGDRAVARLSDRHRVHLCARDGEELVEFFERLQRAGHLLGGDPPELGLQALHGFGRAADAQQRALALGAL